MARLQASERRSPQCGWRKSVNHRPERMPLREPRRQPDRQAIDQAECLMQALSSEEADLRPSRHAPSQAAATTSRAPLVRLLQQLQEPTAVLLAAGWKGSSGVIDARGRGLH